MPSEWSTTSSSDVGVSVQLVPGTRSDPEFSAVRTPAWEAPFTGSFWFPATSGEANRLLTEVWWEEQRGQLEQLALRRHSDDGWLITTEDRPPADSTYVVGTSFPEQLVRAWRASGVGDFETWVRHDVLSFPLEEEFEAGAQPAWRYDLALAHLSATAPGTLRLFVWPDESAQLSLTELLGVPEVPQFPEEPDFAALVPEVRTLATELWNQATTARVTYRLTAAQRAADAIAALRRSTDPQYTDLVTPETGSALRGLSRTLRDKVAASGWRLAGYADALAWPEAITHPDQVPINLVSDLALDVLRRAESAPLPAAPDLAEWDARLAELESLRAARREQR